MNDMLEVEYTTQFKRDLKRAKRRQKDLKILQTVMKNIESENSLSLKWKDHALFGDWVNHRELHLEPDWLLIYRYIPKKKVVVFVRTGSHKDLFKKY